MNQRMWTLASLLALQASVAFAQEKSEQPPITATHVRFADLSLELRNQDGQCTLVKPDHTSLSLQLKWPCQFHRDKAGKLRTKMVGKTPVLLVESSQSMPAPSRDCRTEVQAVRVINGELEPSTAVSRVSACPPFHWDDKVFVGLF